MDTKAFDTREVIEFGHCQIRVATREMVTRGKVRQVEPRVLDALLYLLANADRVVSKDELLKEVWHTAFASDTVVAQCVMKLRRAIEDNDASAPLIKTIQKAGYRFVGHFSRKVEAPKTNGQISPRSSDEPRRIAVLPVSIPEPSDALSSIEFGLACIIIRVFELDGGFTTVPLLDVAKALDHTYFELPVEQRVMLLQETLDIDAVLYTTVRMGSEARPLVEYTVYPSGAPPFQGSCQGPSLTMLGAEVVSGVLNELRKRHGPRRSGPFGDDPFLSEAFLRGLAAARHDYRRLALSYFHICVGAEPHELSVDVEYVDQLAVLTDPATPRRATEVLERAALIGDANVADRVCKALSTYYTGAVLAAQMPSWLQSGT